MMPGGWSRTGAGSACMRPEGWSVAMGGGISIESEPKVGTTVRLTLPGEKQRMDAGEDDASQEPMEQWADTSASTT